MNILQREILLVRIVIYFFSRSLKLKNYNFQRERIQYESFSFVFQGISSEKLREYFKDRKLYTSVEELHFLFLFFYLLFFLLSVLWFTIFSMKGRSKCKTHYVYLFYIRKKKAKNKLKQCVGFLNSSYILITVCIRSNMHIRKYVQYIHLH